MQDRTTEAIWALVFAVIVAFAVPWFLWRNATVVAGLPIWLWWHVGWLVLTSATFYVFSTRGWGLWMGGDRV